MYLITKSGEKATIGEGALSEMPYIPVWDTAVVVNNKTCLKKAWNVVVCKDEYGRRKGVPCEVIAEYRYNHEPTEEDIMYCLCVSGVGLAGYATIEEIWELMQND